MKRIIIAILVIFPVLPVMAQEASIRWSGTNRRDTTISVWKGERIGLEGYFHVDSIMPEPLVVSARGRKGISLEVGILGAVLTDDGRHCGPHDMNLPTYMVWDVIDTDSAWVSYGWEESDTAPYGDSVKIYCCVDVPRDIREGRHYVEVRLVGMDSRNTYAFMGLHLNVVDKSLPAPAEYKFHSDFWQQPYSVSRYYGVERWGREHMEMLRPYMKRLARSGQKCISAILFYEPWGDQSFDKFSPMVETTLKADSTWAYDYSVFDKWVEMMHECGISHQINCYGMIPWDMSFRYWDEAKDDYAFLKLSTSDKAYETLWTSFLKSFAEHLRSKGWLHKTCIAMDERAMRDMMRAYEIIQKAVPGMKVALAGNYHKELAPLLYDYSIAFSQRIPADTLSARKARGQKSTLYTSCADALPNIFTNSHPLEAAYLPLFAIANGLDGYLHWSWMNWGEDPLHDSRYRLFSPGDTYCIYPDNHSSVRWENYLHGVQMAEKVRLMRKFLLQGIDSADNEKEGKPEKAEELEMLRNRLADLDNALSAFASGDAADAVELARIVGNLRNLLNE